VIDFRYHLVSIVAVFLALAVGIVVGTAALNGPVVDGLRSNINRVTADKRALEEDVRALQAQREASDEFAAAVGPRLVADTLADQRVLLVTTPSTPGELADRLRPLLAQAGAEVTGQLEVLPALADPAQRSLLDDLVAQVVPAGVELPDGEPVERATAELAAALAVAPAGKPVTAEEAQAVVSAFEEADLVRFTAQGEALEPATMVVVLVGAGDGRDPDAQAQQRLDVLLTLAAAFDDRSAGAVVAGPLESVLDGGVVGALRQASTLTGEVSSVDNADRGLGRLAVVFALAEQQDGGAGQYGAAAGATAPLPAGAAS
jgi:hypothetical protein